MNTANKTNIVCSNVLMRKILFGFILTLTISSGVNAQKNSANAAKLIAQVPFSTFTGGVVVNIIVERDDEIEAGEQHK